MNWKVIKTEAQYQKAVKRAMQIFHADGKTPEGDELALLLVLIRDYEDRHISIPDLDPIEVIKLKMAETGIKANDLEPLIGSKGHVSSVLAGKEKSPLRWLSDYVIIFNCLLNFFYPIFTK